MSWTLSLQTDPNVTEEDLDKIIGGLPNNLKGFFGGFKEEWGWSTIVDILLPKGSELTLSGAYFSSEAAPMVVKHLKQELEELGYRVHEV